MVLSPGESPHGRASDLTLGKTSRICQLGGCLWASDSFWCGWVSVGSVRVARAVASHLAELQYTCATPCMCTPWAQPAIARLDSSTAALRLSLSVDGVPLITDPVETRSALHMHGHEHLARRVWRGDGCDRVRCA